MREPWKIGVVGSGTMGRGIAQLAADNEHAVVLCDLKESILEASLEQLRKLMHRLIEKGRKTEVEAKNLLANIHTTTNLAELADCDMVIEAIVEKLGPKQVLFTNLEQIVTDECVLATNTSSLSVTSVASPTSSPGRVLGLHFFNPAPLMKLVEVIPGTSTEVRHVEAMSSLMGEWGKTPVVASDTPGFIVNRVARPFYSESIRILEEGIAGPELIDYALKSQGGFRMGPFELMDFIGHDVNFAVTKSVWAACYHEPRYKPSFTQRNLVAAGRLGRKSGQGFYAYPRVEGNADFDDELAECLFQRVLAMLINEAADAVYWGVASRADVDLAMTRGVNYPKGLLQWADDIGHGQVVKTLDSLFDIYREERYRVSPLLRQTVTNNERFHA